MKLRVEYIKRKHKKKVYSYPFLVSSYRDEKGVPQRKIVQKLSNLPDHAVEALRIALKTGSANNLIPRDQIKYDNSLPFGDTWAVWSLLEQLGIVKALKKLSEPHQVAIIASIIDRVVSDKPASKRALRDSFEYSILKRILRQEEQICLSEWYNALDLLYHHQMAMQKVLFQNDIEQLYLYDITSTYFEGEHCPLAKYGYNRDKKKGKMIIVIGLLTNSQGRPIAIRVFSGNTNDQTTVLSQVKELRDEFGVKELVFVGDRGMITSKRIGELESDDYTWVKYITALKRKEMMDFVGDTTHPIQLSLFDHQNLVAVNHDGKRYVLCHNPLRTEEDRTTRLCLLEKTEEKLRCIATSVSSGRLKKKDKIARRLYRWINKWNMERFFRVTYDEGEFEYSRNEEVIKSYEVLDGCYVITSNVEPKEMNTIELHAKYKDLKYVENAFRSMKVSDIVMRPVRHWNVTRVRGHVFMCMLAYLVIWEAKKRLHPLLEREPDTRDCEGKSLREIWSELRRITIGRIELGLESFEQISTVTKEQQKILNLLKVSMNKKAKNLCRQKFGSEMEQS